MNKLKILNEQPTATKKWTQNHILASGNTLTLWLFSFASSSSTSSWQMWTDRCWLSCDLHDPIYNIFWFSKINSQHIKQLFGNKWRYSHLSYSFKFGKKKSSNHLHLMNIALKITKIWVYMIVSLNFLVEFDGRRWRKKRRDKKLKKRMKGEGNGWNVQS